MLYQSSSRKKQFKLLKMFLIFGLLLNFSLYAQTFQMKAVLEGNNEIKTEGKVNVDIANRSVYINANGRETTLNRVIFQKGKEGVLYCYRETIDSKKRIVFEPIQLDLNNPQDATHKMTLTIVNPFSGERVEMIYFLKKEHKRLPSE